MKKVSCSTAEVAATVLMKILDADEYDLTGQAEVI